MKEKLIKFGSAFTFAVLLLLVFQNHAPVFAQSKNKNWWESAVFYQIYPRSFKDTDGDGIGDLNGIIEKLDYLKSLGINAVWITPFYPSPQVDFGYDVSDYTAVDPQFGTLANFDRLVSEAHKRGIRVVVDFVLNHTSDRHPWFLESRSSLTNPKRDWYIWRDGKNGKPPNNWAAAWSSLAWTFDEKTNQFYYHYFDPSQPDLNWRNPEVEKAMHEVLRFWSNRGVDGFRLDALNLLYEDEKLPDNPVTNRPRKGSKTEYEQETIYNNNLPEIHDAMRRMRRYTDNLDSNVLLVGEIFTPTFEKLAEYYGEKDDEVQLPFNFFFTKVPKLSASEFRGQVEAAEKFTEGRTTTYVLSNHDRPRAFDRYGDGENNEKIAKLLATMLLTLRGVPFIYYGEEIGMKTTDPQTIEEVRDPRGLRYFPADKGRDGSRTPMQWNAQENAGFTSGKPWLKIPPQYKEKNVAAQISDPDSILNYYKKLLKLRRKESALREIGKYHSFGQDPNVFAYLRTGGKKTFLIALNMSAEPQPLSLDKLPDKKRRLKTIVSNLTDKQSKRAISDKSLTLAPYQATVFEVF